MMKRESITTLILCAILLTLTIMSKDAKQGAIEGLALCEGIIIPSLLPILIISNIIIKSRCTLVIERTFGWIIEKTLRLPKSTTTAIIFGQIAGYPAGAILTEHLYKTNQITSSQARRIMRFNMCGGVAFLITAIGTIHLNSTMTGVIIYLSSLISSIIIALLSSIGKDKATYYSQGKSALKTSDALIESVEVTTQSILIMCAYIILFSSIMAIMPLPSMINPLIEITNGIMQNDIGISLARLSFYLTFGGICIHMQINSTLSSIKMKYSEFLIFRIIHSTLSYVITAAYCHFFPQADCVFSNISTKTVALSEVNTGLGIVVIIGCVVLIFDIENKKYKLI